MQLPNFLHAGDFNALRLMMGASLSDSYNTKQVYNPISLPEISDKLRNDGIDVAFEEIAVLNDGTLSYKGYRVLLYIRDVAEYGERSGLPKYHLAFCRTLDQMRKNKRWSRYVVANRDDGKFAINLIGDTSRALIERLSICQNCLEKISWKGFHNELTRIQRQKFVEEFRLQEFFEKFPRDLISVKPEKTSDTAPLNDYPSNWPDISEAFKQKNGHRCMKCRLELKGLKSRYLHVHHVNGQKNECQDSNLEVLCIRCHADEPLHSHMKDLPDYKNFLATFGGAS
jgi:hypothetical protein